MKCGMSANWSRNVIRVYPCPSVVKPLFSFLFCFLLWLAAAPGAASVTDTARAEVERASARLERLREAYAAGAVSRLEMEEADAELRDAERRLRAASEPRELTPKEAGRRVEEARYDFEKASAKAKKLHELYEAGVASRNEAEAAEAAAKLAETCFQLNQELARRVEFLASLPDPTAEPAAGSFSFGAFFFLQDLYYREFRQPLPVSAFGPSEAHDKMGFDHEGRIDIALHPESPEGRWLVAQLEIRRIPFVAFRTAVTGKATGAHIHLGFPSPTAAQPNGTAGPNPR